MHLYISLYVPPRVSAISEISRRKSMRPLMQNQKNDTLACSRTTSPHLLTNGDQSLYPEMSWRWKYTCGVRMVLKNYNDAAAYSRFIFYIHLGSIKPKRVP